jgi:hypothetical protein
VGTMRRVSLKNCPYCDCSEVYAPSTRTLWQKMAVLFFLRLVRCHVCMRRHFRPIFLPATKHPATDTTPRKPAEVVAMKKKEKRPA